MTLRIFQSILLQLVLFTASAPSHDKADKPMRYIVQKARESFRLEDLWDQGQWANTEKLYLANFMGPRPEHFPHTQAKLLYDESTLYVFFRVKDQYVRAVAEQFHDPVCQDSCVEFFFTCGTDIATGYFNLETNCSGMLLFYHQIKKGKNARAVATEDCKQIKVVSSLPEKVDPEVTEPTLWTVKYALPIDILRKYASVDAPGPHVLWKANFYKCADKTSHPHWLTWNPVDRPSPNFHLPQYFGTIEFE